MRSKSASMYLSCSSPGSAISLSSPSLQEPSERPQVEVQVLLLQAERLPELLHPLLEQHERLAEALDLVRGQRAALDAPKGLTLHELSQQLDQRQYEPGESLLHVLAVRRHAAPE